MGVQFPTSNEFFFFHVFFFFVFPPNDSLGSCFSGRIEDDALAWQLLPDYLPQWKQVGYAVLCGSARPPACCIVRLHRLTTMLRSRLLALPLCPSLSRSVALCVRAMAQSVVASRLIVMGYTTCRFSWRVMVQANMDILVRNKRGYLYHI